MVLTKNEIIFSFYEYVFEKNEGKIYQEKMEIKFYWLEFTDA